MFSLARYLFDLLNHANSLNDSESCLLVVRNLK